MNTLSFCLSILVRPLLIFSFILNLGFACSLFSSNIRNETFQAFPIFICAPRGQKLPFVFCNIIPLCLLIIIYMYCQCELIEYLHSWRDYPQKNLHWKLQFVKLSIEVIFPFTLYCLSFDPCILLITSPQNAFRLSKCSTYLTSEDHILKYNVPKVPTFINWSHPFLFDATNSLYYFDFRLPWTQIFVTHSKF